MPASLSMCGTGLIKATGELANTEIVIVSNLTNLAGSKGNLWTAYNGKCEPAKSAMLFVTKKGEISVAVRDRECFDAPRSCHDHRPIRDRSIHHGDCQNGGSVHRREKASELPNA